MRLDHVVIAVRDLGAASERLRGAGFDVRPGGRHVGFGTENAICRFGLDYLELISVRDHGEAERASVRSRALSEYVRRHESGYVGFALAGDDLHAVGGRLRTAGLRVGDPTPMQRERPDGTVLQWQLLIPEEIAWRRPWPFFIDWALPDERRLALETVGTHANGVTGIGGVSVAVGDIVRARSIYRAALGPSTYEGSGRSTFDADGVDIDLVAPAAGSPLLQRGPGPFEVRLRLADGRARPAAEPLPGVRFTYG